MKTCPYCKNQYSDNTLQFCLQDGTPLTWRGLPETPTAVITEIETVVPRSGQGRVSIPISDPKSPAFHPSQVTDVAMAMPEKKRPNTVLAVGLTAIGMLVLFGVIVIAAIVFSQNRQQDVYKLPNTNVFGANANYHAGPTPSVTTAPVRTPPTSMPAGTPQSMPAPLKSYPSTTRLKFGRGTYSTSFSGDINPSDSRSLVLACRAGQSLSVNVSGGGGCVQLSGGGSSLRTTTNRGDNYLGVTNNCSTVVHFSVSITII